MPVNTSGKLVKVNSHSLSQQRLVWKEEGRQAGRQADRQAGPQSLVEIIITSLIYMYSVCSQLVSAKKSRRQKLSMQKSIKSVINTKVKTILQIHNHTFSHQTQKSNQWLIIKLVLTVLLHSHKYKKKSPLKISRTFREASNRNETEVRGGVWRDEAVYTRKDIMCCLNL